jgi:hypothetical protein
MALATPPSIASARRVSRLLAAPTDEAEAIAVAVLPDGGVEVTHGALLWGNFAYFFAHLTDDAGDPYLVEPHHVEWCHLMQRNPLLVLMAPRDHGKTVTVIAYIGWKAWRHNRQPDGSYYPSMQPDGGFQAVIFSETLPQAEHFFDALQALLLGNPALFGEIIPSIRRGRVARGVWSRRRIRLQNGFECTIRAFRTSTRGMHPDLIICDDVLSDRNSQTAYQRSKVWTYFVGTLMPMNAAQVIVIGTAQHHDDLLHRLRPDPKKPPLIIRNVPTRFVFKRYKAIDWDTGEVLWEARHNRADLEGRRAQDALLFSREWQNDPRDDASSLFPYPLTGRALDKTMTFLPVYRAGPQEFVLLGHDLAVSGEVGADYTVIFVVLYSRVSGTRRLLWGLREQGMTLDDQLTSLRSACSRYNVAMGVVEENGFQRWLFTEAQKWPETRGRLVGHRTGREKSNLTDGVPGLRLALDAGLWIFPAGDEESLALASAWQSEMSAFGWKDGKLQGSGEHDDLVMATWFVERAVRIVEEWIAATPPTEETVYGEDEGLDRYVIDPTY